LFGLVVGCGLSSADEIAMKELMMREVPVGSDQSRVVTFLESHHFKEYGLHREGKRFRGVHRDAARMLFLFPQDLVVDFLLDDEDRVKDYSVEIWSAMP
jgi:hypothetical protein